MNPFRTVKPVPATGNRTRAMTQARLHSSQVMRDLGHRGRMRRHHLLALVHEVGRKRYFVPHVFDLRLNRHYGNFRCEECGAHFHHAPSTLYEGKSLWKECVCGDCTNQIIADDWNYRPYR
ncbi:hypothetical protein SAMN05421823_11923 [Catalinimonas alkaloidigena]|uniref:Uncharacterized protein n=1 Tax=Catalinimonas alkaloidigena TaxID=1075417 RepID=A0A1G9V5R9_9BACT|nr:hypothetical protein [Catalinimonas alkaloidigena]SDM67453.1 hypothetical protein SAMN05421823_11923 [Catalinimonas alkaloidigena]